MWRKDGSIGRKICGWILGMEGGMCWWNDGMRELKVYKHGISMIWIWYQKEKVVDMDMV